MFLFSISELLDCESCGSRGLVLDSFLPSASLSRDGCIEPAQKRLSAEEFELYNSSQVQNSSQSEAANLSSLFIDHTLCT